MEHKWVGWRREAVRTVVSAPPAGAKGSPVHATREMKLWRCSCGAEVYAEPGHDMRAEPCQGSEASLRRHRF